MTASKKVFLAIPVGDVASRARAACPDHPGVPSQTDDGLSASCPECGASCRLCGERLGSKACSLPRGHAGSFHVSPSGSSWPATPHPFGDGWSADRVGARVYSLDCVSAYGMRASVQVFIDPPKAWFESLAEVIEPAGEPVYACNAWRARVGAIGSAAARSAASLARVSLRKKMPKGWLKGISIWACRNGAAILRLEAAKGDLSVVVAVDPGHARALPCGSCHGCAAAGAKA